MKWTHLPKQLPSETRTPKNYLGQPKRPNSDSYRLKKKNKTKQNKTKNKTLIDY